MVLLLTTVLAAAPVSTPTLRAKLDVGGLIGASWYVPAGRERIELALNQTRAAVFGDEHLQLATLAWALPMVGPLLTAREADNTFDRVALLTSGVLQAIGLTVGAARWLDEDDAAASDEGTVLSISPIAGGHLGLSVRLTGF